VGGLFHTDELPKYGITDEEVNKLKKFMNCGENDAVILVADAKNKAERALLAVIERAKESLIGIPEETRKALDDGNTSYLRPLPGAARMYPETDVPKILITSEICERIKNNLPEMPEEKTIRFIKEYELNEDLAKQMVMSHNVELFENLSKKYPNIKPTLIATTLEATLKEIKREGLDTEVLTDEHLNELFLGLSEDKMSKEAIPEVIKGYINNPNMKLDEVLDVAGLSKMSKEEVEAVILDIINQNILIVNEKGMGATGLLMGRCMAQLRGKADGKLINVTLQNKLKEKVQGQ
jgi:glutamyl-tRNA(Gln) amidotransferase subunit E